MHLKFFRLIGVLILCGNLSTAHAVEGLVDLNKIPDGAVVLPAAGVKQSRLIEVPRGMSIHEFFAAAMGTYYKSNMLVVNDMPNANMHRWWLMNPKIIESLANNQKPDPREVAYYEARWVNYEGKRLLRLTKVLVEEVDLNDFNIRIHKGALEEVNRYIPAPGAPAKQAPDGQQHRR